MDVCSGCLHNSPNLETSKTSFGRWRINEPWSIQTREYCSAKEMRYQAIKRCGGSSVPATEWKERSCRDRVLRSRPRAAGRRAEPRRQKQSVLAAAAGGGMERRTAENHLSGEGPASPRAGPLGSTSVSTDACSQGLGGSEGKGPRAPTPSVALWYEGAHSLSCPHCSLVPCGIATSILIFSPFGSPRPHSLFRRQTGSLNKTILVSWS